MIAELVEWLLRALVIMFVFRVIARLFTGGARRPSQPTTHARTSERTGGTLVRDPQCGTYVSTERSFHAGHGASTLYFCSAACRDAYAASH